MKKKKCRRKRGTKNFIFVPGIFRIEQSGKFVDIKIIGKLSGKGYRIEQAKPDTGYELRPQWQSIVKYLNIKRHHRPNTKSIINGHILVAEIGHKDARHTIRQIKKIGLGKPVNIIFK